MNTRFYHKAERRRAARMNVRQLPHLLLHHTTARALTEASRVLMTEKKRCSAPTTTSQEGCKLGGVGDLQKICSTSESEGVCVLLSPNPHTAPQVLFVYIGDDDAIVLFFIIHSSTRRARNKGAKNILG